MPPLDALMRWFYETATHDLSKSVAKDLLARYGFIGPRVTKLIESYSVSTMLRT